jgi:xylulokinase
MWLGLDIGTSAVKTVIFDAAGGTAARSSVPLTISRPRPGWSEQSPQDWWQTTVSALTALPETLR